MSRRLILLAIGFLFGTSSICAEQAGAQEKHTLLKATPSTVAWGYYDAKAKPVLTVKSGEIVDVETLLTNSPKRLEAAGVAPEQVEQ